MTSTKDRADQFASLASPDVKPRQALSAANRGSLLERGTIYLGTFNLERFTKPDDDSLAMAFHGCFRWIPDDEVHVIVRVQSGMDKLRERLTVLTRAAKAGAKNNNVRAYLHTDGNVYLDNEPHDSLPLVETIGPAVPVARANYAIHSPVTGTKGLAAQQFTAFIAKIIGLAKTYPHAPWVTGAVVDGATPAAVPVARAVRRPKDIPLVEIKRGIAERQGHYDDEIIERFHAGLTYLDDKHFVVLAGVSGSGKSSLVTKYAHTIHGLPMGVSADEHLFFVAVQPDWTDRTGLVGYADAINDRYVVPRFLEALLIATANPDAAVIVCLDEMNLARIEHYLADVLSCMENRNSTIHLHSQIKAMVGDNGMQVPDSLPMPPNLFLIGTINVDETTHRIADKVLDRAIYIDTSKVDIRGFLEKLDSADASLGPSIAVARDLLMGLSNALSKHDMQFGYRTTREIVFYLKRTTELGRTPAQTLDEVLAQKVLTKLKGGPSQQGLLDELGVLLKDCPRSTGNIDKMKRDLADYGTFQAVR